VKKSTRLLPDDPVTTDSVAECIDVSTPTLNTWQATKGFPKKPTLRNVFAWFRKRAEGDMPEGSQRGRIASAQAAKLEMLVKREAGKLVPIEIVRAAVSKYNSIASEEWSAFPLRVTTDEKIQAEIRAAVIVIRNNITKRCQEFKSIGTEDSGDVQSPGSTTEDAS
jgi:hypothetical protein